jgi:integrase
MLATMRPDLVAAIPLLRRPPPRTVQVEPEQFTSLYEAAPPHLKLFLLLCRTLGLRFQEAFRLCPLDYDADRRSITVTVKGGRHRTLPVTEEIAALLALAPSTEPRATPYVALLKGSKRCSEKSMRRSWRQAIKNSGVPDGLRPHDLRRSAAVALYEKTRDLRIVQQLLGHAQMYTTAQYIAPFDPEAMRPYLEALSPFAVTKRRHQQ